MKTHLIEVTNGERNWGKFLLGQFDATEQARASVVSPSHTPFLRQLGWGDPDGYALVLDLQTGEGAVFRLGGSAPADLNKHRIWVCPLFEPFLVWLYAHAATADWWTRLPPHVDLPDAPFAVYGYRRGGVQPHD